MKDPKAEGMRWLEQATRDLQAAETIYKDELWWIACFQAQQAAEKAIKAYLYASGQRVVLGHSVSDLAREATRTNPGFENLTRAGAQLDRFYTPTRYPNGLPGGIPATAYAKEDADQALELAKTVLEFVKGAF